MNIAFNTKFFKITLYSVIFWEFLSFFAFLYPILNKIFFLLVLFLALVLSFKKLEYGVYIIFTELLIGSKGYLFGWEIGEKIVSVRIGLFVVVMGVWALKRFWLWKKTGKTEIRFLNCDIFPYYFLLFIFIIWGVVWGVLNKNSFLNIFFDVNGWFYFLLAFPVFEVLKKENLGDFFSVLVAALIALILKTFFLFFVFSHNFIFLMPDIYRWVRVTGVGEITDMGFGFYRIFFQSHIFAILSFFVLLPILNKKFVLKREELKKNFLFLSFYIFLISIIIISFSRSFWLGFVVVFFFFYYISFFVLKNKFKFLIVNFLLVSALLISGAAWAGFLIKIPTSLHRGGQEKVKFILALEKRTKDISQENAVGSRWNLLGPLVKSVKNNLIFGAGFGKTVTYKTKDPRALRNNPDGFYTTYAFEWGYLDIWLKIGILGILAYLLLLFQILKKGWRHKKEEIIFGSWLGLLALMVIHFFTPYLNHPLGIGYILIWSAIYEILD